MECQCGECAIDEFVAGKDCKKSARRSVPKLTIKTRDSDQDILPTCRQEMRFSDYKNSLKEKDNEIRTEYSYLLLITMQALKTNYSLEIAKQRVRSLLTPKDSLGSQYKRMYKRGLNKRLKDVQTYEELQQFLEQFCSWFNIDFIADLRKVLLGYDSKDSVIVTYKEHLRRYLQRCCFQLTVCDLEGQTERNELVCRTSTNFSEIKEEQIDIFEHRLGQCICILVSQRRISECGKEMVFCVKEPLPPVPIERLDVRKSAVTHPRKKSFILGFILMIISSCIQGLAFVPPAHQTKSLGSVRIHPGENVTLLANFSVSSLKNELKVRLFFTKHPFTDCSSITIHDKECNGSQYEEITNCTISSSNHSCSLTIQRAALSSEVSVCIFASLHTSSSLPVIEYGMVYSYRPMRDYYIFGISLVIFLIAFFIMPTGLNKCLSIILGMLPCIQLPIYYLIVSNPLSIPL